MKKFLVPIVCILAAFTFVWFGLHRQNDQQLLPKKETTITPSNMGSSIPPYESGCSYTLIGWNLNNLGRKKTDEEIEIMAKVLAHGDIVAIQEVVAGKEFGAQATARLATALGRTGAAWDYIVSDPTRPPSDGVERYAYFWKEHRVSVNRDDAHLVDELQNSIDREPYALSFELKGIPAVRVFTIHAVPTAKQPMAEVKALTAAKAVRAGDRVIVAGDFNLDPKKTDPLFGRIGFTGNINTHTSLKSIMRKEGHTARQYDNIYTRGVTVCKSGVIDFVSEHFSPVTNASLKQARHLSDHLPVYINFR